MTSLVLDHRLLRQFLAVAEAGSVRAGAERLNISQPPLTQAIKRLEEGLGVTLFERLPKGMALTRAGAELQAEARQILMHIERAEQRVHAASVADAPIRIGFVSAALNGALTTCIRRFADDGRQVALEEMTSPQQLEALSRGQIDLALLHPPVDDRNWTVASLGRDPFVAAIPSEWDLAKRKSLRFKDIAKMPLVLFPPEQGPSLMSAIERMTFEAGVTLGIVATAPRVHSQLAIISSGIGAGLVTEATSRTLKFSGVKYVPIADSRERLFLELQCVGRPEIIEIVV